MMLRNEADANPNRLTRPGVTTYHPILMRVEQVAKLRAKRSRCQACDGKVCVGRCKFPKTHEREPQPFTLFDRVE